MDEKDEYILNKLRRDGRISYTKIAKGLKISEGAVRKRVQNLIKAGVIKRFTIEEERKGTIKSLMMVSVDTKIPNPWVAKEIKKIPVVERVYEIAGEYDLVVVFSNPDIAKINSCIDLVREIKGVKKTNTILILKEWR